jgi:hypothetical protein
MELIISNLIDRFERGALTHRELVRASRRFRRAAFFARLNPLPQPLRALVLTTSAYRYAIYRGQ